ncbi:uncharacterized protein [Littorina saxatilis]|uniref:Uncharacterized protein n=1 Tax=Littorina saxatilis TaxID=31220 RepID=A0AAN9G0D0_9CAEN
MADLMESLDQSKWQKVDVSKKQAGYTEFQVMRQHKKLSPTSYRYVIQTDADEDPKGVVVEFTEKEKDPLKDIGTAELLLKEGQVVGIDLDGDCCELK